MRWILLPQLWKSFSLGFVIVLIIPILVGASPGPTIAAVEVWYGPDDRPLEHLVQTYDRAKRYIFVAAYGLTSLCR